MKTETMGIALRGVLSAKNCSTLVYAGIVDNYDRRWIELPREMRQFYCEVAAMLLDVDRAVEPKNSTPPQSG